VQFNAEELKALTQRIQEAGTEVVKAKAGAVFHLCLVVFNYNDVLSQGSATLSMALAAEYFVSALIRALKGEKNVQCAYVKSNLVKDVEYFAGPVELGPNGVVGSNNEVLQVIGTFKEKILPFKDITSYEKELIEKAIPDLKKEIAKGVDFIRKGV
jgi:malate dehydrogenase